MASPDDLDSFDLRLLALMQDDARASAAALSEAVGLSVPACYRRIQRLRRIGAIKRDVSIVDPVTMGWPLTIIVLVTLDRESERILDDFRRAIARVPEVIEAWYVTGEHDFVLRMVARDMSSFDKQISDLLYSKPFIRSFKTLVTFRNLKPLSGIPATRRIGKIDESGDR